jgi:hypothetical protein
MTASQKNFRDTILVLPACAAAAKGVVSARLSISETPLRALLSPARDGILPPHPTAAHTTMNAPVRHEDPEHRFDLIIPTGWSAAPDEDDGGLEVWNEAGSGTLHVIAFGQGPEEFPDPAEELYAFLEERGVELQEDEVEDLVLPGDAELALCEYTSEDEEDGEELYWMVGVATAPGVLAFATYFCPAADADRERAVVRAALESLRLREADAPAE